MTTHLLKTIMATNNQYKKLKSWFYIFLQNFLLPHYTNMGKGELCIKCSQVGVFA